MRQFYIVLVGFELTITTLGLYFCIATIRKELKNKMEEGCICMREYVWCMHPCV